MGFKMVVEGFEMVVKEVEMVVVKMMVWSSSLIQFPVKIVGFERLLDFEVVV